MMLKAIDVSTSRVTKEWWDKHSDVRALVQNLWPGGWADRDVYRVVAPANLQTALQQGRLVAGYVVVTPDQPSQWYGRDVLHEVIAEARTRAGAAWNDLRFIAIDVETLHDRGVTYWPSVERVVQWCERFATMKPVCIYTGWWFLRQYYGGVPAAFKRWPLWYAHYNNRPSLEPLPWMGGWKVIGHQYGGDQVDGVTLDWNVFDAAWLGGDSVDPRLDEEVEVTVWENWQPKVVRTSLLQYLRWLVQRKVFNAKELEHQIWLQDLTRRVAQLEEAVRALEDRMGQPAQEEASFLRKLYQALKEALANK